MDIKTIKKNYKACLRKIRMIRQALLLKCKYFRTIHRLRKVYGKRKIFVAFSVSEIAKWKSQSLYDRLEQSAEYTPIIFVYPSPMEFNIEGVNIDALLKEKVSFFRNKNMRVLNIWDSVSQKCIIPTDCRPDIIFYQQPWDTPLFPLPTETADNALTFYIPYYLINNFDINIEFGLPLHYQVFGYIVLNEQAVKLYKSMIKGIYYAGKCLGLGHTIVDGFTKKVPPGEHDCVIYAPHFSFPVEGFDRLLTYSTFLDNGKLILQYAKQHPEIKWVFKPHPRLWVELQERKIWSVSEINSYYEEWAKIGTVCTTSDYTEHFQKSFAMITDCGSFLTEYSCMDRPLIRLYYHKDNLPPNPIMTKLYKTFYYAHNNEELLNLLDSVIGKREDPLQEERHKEVVSLGLCESNAAQKIVDYLDSLLSNK